MPKPPAGPAPELTALLAMDRVELAADVFVQAFTPVIDEPYPRTSHLAWTVAEVTAVKLGRWGLDTDKPNDGAIARLVAELTVLWERADLAARGVYHDGTGIVLLFRGEELLRGDDAHGAIAAALRAANPPR